ncbi:hypothetical protein GF342_00665 [Candidatus Woesearchaeota archaeon]|nr:hypothetical protein [Candidatus Woesearchaeota archaeon]
MKRKVSRIGPATLMVSLPSQWVKENKVEKGQEIDVVPRGNKLLIQTDTAAKTYKTTLDLRTPTTATQNYIGHQARTVKQLYRFGVDEITIQYNDKRVIRQIQHEIQRQLLGFEIVSQGDKVCTIKNIAAGLDSEFNAVLRRLFFLTMSMADDALDAMKKKDKERLEEMPSMEMTQNKLHNLCERMLNKHGFEDNKCTTLIYALVRQLEEVGDALRDVSLYALERNLNMPKPFLEKFASINKELRAFHDVFYSYDIDKASSHKERHNALRKECIELLTKAKPGDGRYYHYLVVLLLKINDMGASFRLV